MARTITIFGASSSIAKEYIKKAKNKHLFMLFSRNYKKTKEWIENNNLNTNCTPFEYKQFNKSHSTDAIINFVGAGDPQKVIDYGKEIIKINKLYDDKIMNYLKINSNVHYIYLSSGSVYATDFAVPIKSVTETPKNIKVYKNLNPYSAAKLSSELIHRQSKHLVITDIRVFNYLKERDIENEKSLIGEIIKCIMSNKRFSTPQKEIFRDYINSQLFFEGIESILKKPLNRAYDFYSKSPVSKSKLLIHLNQKFNLQYHIEIDILKKFESPTGFKSHYYSLDKSLGEIGYFPRLSSLEVIDEVVKNYVSRQHS